MAKNPNTLEGAARMPKSKSSKNTVRMHVQMPKDWQKMIKAAAKKLNMSRSNYVANVAMNAAKLEMAAGPKR